MTDFTADGYRCKGCSEKIGAGELRVVRLQLAQGATVMLAENNSHSSKITV